MLRSIQLAATVAAAAAAIVRRCLPPLAAVRRLQIASGDGELIQR